MTEDGVPPTGEIPIPLDHNDSGEKPPWRRPHKLQPEDDASSFRCGQPELDEWIARYGLINQRAGMATVFVVADANRRVDGYYALCTGGVEHVHAPSRATRGVARHPIPVIILSRLAVHEDRQGLGLGHALLRDALLRVEAAADEVGIRALLMHAKDEDSKRFYTSFGEFEESPTDPLHLFLLMKDLRAALHNRA